MLSTYAHLRAGASDTNNVHKLFYLKEKYAQYLQNQLSFLLKKKGGETQFYFDFQSVQMQT